MMEPRKYPLLLVALVVILAVLAGCTTEPEVVVTEVTVEKEVTVEVPKEVEVTLEVPVEVTRIVSVEVTPMTPPEPEMPVIHENALHVTTGGMAYFYSTETGGFETLTGIPYSDLSCKNCHVDECSDCHVSETMAPPPQSMCLACHGRQRAEIGTETVTDVHRSAGMTCVNCHTMEETHGDGQEYNSLLETQYTTMCEDCHTEVSDTSAHTVHGDKLDCSTCHVRSVVNCYNCHFDTEIKEQKKVANRRFFDTRLLVKVGDKIHLGNFMSIVYQDKSFFTIAPFYGHSIGVPDPETICAECHQNGFVQEYKADGTMTIATWNEAEGKIVNTPGVVPVPPDFDQALQFPFVTMDENGNWVFLRDSAEGSQMLFAEPLDEMPPQFP